jgi:hypothetical protein
LKEQVALVLSSVARIQTGGCMRKGKGEEGAELREGAP